MSSNQPFAPYYGQTQSAISAAGATVFANPIPSNARQLLIQNVGTVLVYFKMNPAGDVKDATAVDLPIPAGKSIVITKDGGNYGVADGQTRASIFSSGAGSTVYLTPGDGYGTPA